MGETPPIRPQRGMVRRETTGGLLMSVIRSLSTSRDSADRDRERLELEKGYNQCDQKLNELISENTAELNQVMGVFSRILNNLGHAKERLLGTREKLQNCQKLLHCKRDELKKLWLEVVENRAVFDLLERIEQVAALPRQIEDYSAKKHYLHAAQCCVDGLRQLGEDGTSGPGSPSYNASLCKVEALNEIREDLLSKKEKLFESALDELHRHLYQVATEEVRRRFQRVGSFRSEVANRSRKISTNFASLETSISKTEKSTNKENGHSDDYPEEDSLQYISMLTKCLGLLNKIPDAVKVIKERLDDECINIVMRTAQEVLSPASRVTENNNAKHLHPSQNLAVLTCTTLLGHHYNGFSHLDGSSSSYASELRLPKSALQLQEFFNMLLQEFNTVVTLHDTVVLANLKRIESGLHAAALDPESSDLSLSGPTSFYSASELWVKIQVLIQQLLDYYLDISNMSNPNLANMNTSSNFASVALHLLLSGVSTGHSGIGQGGTNVTGSSLTSNENYSSYFTKRRPLAGAMSAMNVMTKSTMSVAVAAATGSTTGSASNSATMQSGDTTDQLVPMSSSNTLGTLSPSTAGSTQTLREAVSGAAPNTGTGNFLSSVMSSRNTNLNLFKFDSSCQAISWNTFLAEQHHSDQLGTDSDKLDDDGESGKPKSHSSTSRLFESLQAISAPTPDNLVVVFTTLLKQISKCLSFDQNQSKTSGLQSYLLTSAEKFLSHINMQLEKLIDGATKSLETCNTITLCYDVPTGQPGRLTSVAEIPETAGSDLQQNMSNYQHQSVNRINLPLLESAVLVDVSTRDLCVLMQAMPEYRMDLLGYICNVLNNYKDSCIAAYQTIVQTNPMNGPTAGTLDSQVPNNYPPTIFSYEKRVISANWAKDEDINRLLKSLPNWTSLLEQQRQAAGLWCSTPSPMPNQFPGSRNLAARRPINQMSFDESPEDIRLRNLRETEILTANLSQEIPRNELLWQEGQLRQLAHFQESFEWLAARCDDLVEAIQLLYRESAKRHGPLETDDHQVYIATLNQMSKDFAELAQTCLLVLHLEVRVHCFYHLQVLDSSFFNSSPPALDGTNKEFPNAAELYSDDPKIRPLLEDLRRMHDELQSASLKSAKMVYIFEGLGHLITTIFMQTTTGGSVRRIKHNGVKRTCRAIYDIQRRLTVITRSRELALDYARQYFELLLLTPDEILASVIERGPQFQHSEYVAALVLIHQSGLATMHHSGMTQAPPSDTSRELERQLHRLDEILNGISISL